MTLSRRNPRLVRLRRLVRDRRARDEHGVTVVEGGRALATALACGAVVTEVFARPDRLDEVAALGMTPVEVAADVLDAVADTVTPQGVLAVVEASHAPLEDHLGASRVLAVDRVADPGNVGALVRTAVAAGFDHVVTSRGCADPSGPRAVRASAGTRFAATVTRDVDLAEALGALGGAGHRVVGADASGEPLHIAEPGPLATAEQLTLVVGSEAHGLDAAASQRCDAVVALAMADVVESLNVAVTGGILMYSLGPRRTP